MLIIIFLFLYVIICIQEKTTACVSFDDKMKNKIINTSPFRVESQIVPNDEKEKFLKMFNNHKINESLFPDYIILKLEDLVNELPIKNKIFELIISNNTYKIYKKS